MHDSRSYLTAYITQQGGVKAAAQRLSMPYPSLAAVANGTRGISKWMADRMVQADPMLDWNRLVTIRAIARQEKAA